MKNIIERVGYHVIIRNSVTTAPSDVTRTEELQI